MNEIVFCKRCGADYEAMTQEIASYFCPNCMKAQAKRKIVDEVSLKYLTEVNSSSETQDPNCKFISNGDTHGEEKIKS